MAIGRTNAGGGGNLTGDAVAGDVLVGKTFYNTDPHAKQTGTLPDQSGQSITAAQGDISGGQYRLLAPAAAKYSGATRLQRPQASVAADIGLTAAKLAKGNTVLGVAGSYVAPVMTGNGTVTIAFSNGSKTVDVRMRSLPFKPLAMRIGGMTSGYSQRLVAVRDGDANSTAMFAGIASNGGGPVTLQSSTWSNTEVRIIAVTEEGSFSTGTTSLHDSNCLAIGVPV